MPGKHEHQQAATENYRAMNFLATRMSDFPQWVTIIAFYTARHVVNAMFAADGSLHCDDHGDRNRRLKSTRRYSHLWRHDRELWNDSLIARYLADSNGSEYPHFAIDMSPERVRKVHVEHNLHQIIKSARTLLKDESFLSDTE